MFLFVIAACGRSHYPTCDYETRDVADDESGLGDLPFVVNDLLGLAVGTFDIPAEASAGAVTSVELIGSRGEGTAILEDGTEGDSVTPFFGFGDRYIDIAVNCSDRVTVPLNVLATSDDGTFDVAGEATLTGESYGNGTMDASASGAVDADGAVTASGGEEDGSFWAGFDDDGLYRMEIGLSDGATLSAPPGYP